MNVELESSGCSIVLIGSFNPAIFHPAWFEKHGIITADEADQSDLQVVHPEIAQMTLGTTTVTVEQQRFSVKTDSAPWIKLSDFLSTVFGEILPHTPIQFAGINTHRHFRLPSFQDRIEFGRRLAPLAPWGAFGERVKSGVKDNVSGVQILAMREFWEDDPFTGWNQVKLEPSTQIPNNSGVHVEINHHIQAMKGGGSIAAPDLVAYIGKKFDVVTTDAIFISDELFKYEGN